jgi:hypothetical protein
VYTGRYVRPGVTHIDDIWEHVLIGGFVLLHWWDMKSHQLLEKVVKKVPWSMVAQYGPINCLKNVFTSLFLNYRTQNFAQRPNASFDVKGEELGVITVFY